MLVRCNIFVCYFIGHPLPFNLEICYSLVDGKYALGGTF